MEGARPDHRSAATLRVFPHSHQACAAGDVLRQPAAVLRYASRVRLIKRAQKFAPFSGMARDVLAPLQLWRRFVHDPHTAHPTDIRGTSVVIAPGDLCYRATTPSSRYKTAANCDATSDGGTSNGRSPGAEMFGAWSHVGSAASPCIKHFLVMKADFHWFWSVNTNRSRRRASRYVRGPVFCEVYMLQLEQLRCWTTDGRVPHRCG
jgi:hypothetical protein